MPAKPHRSRGALVVLAKTVLWAVLVVLSVATTRLLVVQARAEFAHESAGLSGRVVLARELDPTVAEYAKSRGDFWLKSSIPPRPRLAEREYRRALELNPYEAFHWSDWGQVCWHLGRVGEARQAFATAETLDPNNDAIQCVIGDFLLARGEIDAAASHHTRAIRLRPALARSFWTVYWGLGRPAATVADELLGDDPVLWRQYFLDCLGWVDPEQADRLWQGLEQHKDALDAACHSAYFDFLVAKREYGAARSLWQLITDRFYPVGPDDEDVRFWNGKFDHPLAFDGGLEWRIAKRQPPGVRTSISSTQASGGGNSLWIHFAGKENVAFSHVRHFFFVEPNRPYRLAYRVTALDITTDNGPYVQLTLHGDPPQRHLGRAVTGTGPQELEVSFVAPTDCHWAEITICRDPSRKLNNRIQGDVWYDDFVLEARTEPTSGTLSQ